MERSDVWFIAVVTAAIGFIAGMAWCDFGHQEDWVSNYQTLITGILAVAAAYVTVNAMSRAEDRQQSRHDELLKLSLRADRLRVQRAEYPFADVIDDFSIRISDLIKVMDDASDSSSIADAFASANEHAIGCKNIFTEGAVEEARVLFGPNMSDSYIFLTRSVKRALHRCDRISQFIAANPGTQIPLNLFKEIRSELDDIRMEMPRFAAHLRNLAKEYQ